MSTTKTEPVYWMGEVPKQCQLSGRAITTTFVDGRVPPLSSRVGSWACMHPVYFRQLGGKLGLGMGQRYERQPDGRWLKVEG